MAINLMLFVAVKRTLLLLLRFVQTRPLSYTDELWLTLPSNYKLHISFKNVLETFSSIQVSNKEKNVFIILNIRCFGVFLGEKVLYTSQHAKMCSRLLSFVLHCALLFYCFSFIGMLLCIVCLTSLLHGYM